MEHRRQRGLTLIELMIAMVLGLLVTLAVVNLFLTTRAVYRQNENLARMQESARFAFEFLGRDIREAGGIPCGRDLPTDNVLNNSSSNWWSNWEDANGRNGINGYDDTQDTFPPRQFGSNAGDRVANTDAFVLRTGSFGNNFIITEHKPTSAEFTVNTTAHGLKQGDIVMVCDYRQAAIFQVTNANSNKIFYNNDAAGGSVSPGNSPTGMSHTFKNENGGFPGSKFSAFAWYVGHNDRGGTSLYRVRMNNTGGTVGVTTDEIVEGVTDMQVTYLVRADNGTLANDYVGASAVAATDWEKVVAVRVALTFASLENVGTEQQRLTRSLITVYTLRNRAP